MKLYNVGMCQGNNIILGVNATLICGNITTKRKEIQLYELKEETGKENTENLQCAMKDIFWHFK